MPEARPLSPEEVTQAAMELGSARRELADSGAGDDAINWLDAWGERLIRTVLLEQRRRRRFERSHQALAKAAGAGAAFLKETTELIARFTGTLPKSFGDELRGIGRTRSAIVLGQLAVAEAALEFDDVEEITAAAQKKAAELLGRNARPDTLSEMQLDVPEVVH